MGKCWSFETSSPLVPQDLHCDLGMARLQVRLGDRVGNGDGAPWLRVAGRLEGLRETETPVLRETSVNEWTRPSGTRATPQDPTPPFPSPLPSWMQNTPLRNQFPQLPKEVKSLPYRIPDSLPCSSHLPQLPILSLMDPSSFGTRPPTLWIPIPSPLH